MFKMLPIVVNIWFNIFFNFTNNSHPSVRFSINLTLGIHQRDIALHINPRLPQNYIVRNCKVNGAWGREEVTSAMPFTLRRGRQFTMQILITEPEYYISIDGRHFAAFRHRLPVQKVSCLQVVGDVSDVSVELLAVMEYPDRKSSRSTAVLADELNDNANNDDADDELVKAIPQFDEHVDGPQINEVAHPTYTFRNYLVNFHIFFLENVIFFIFAIFSKCHITVDYGKS